jgi:hypothetical protein
MWGILCSETNCCLLKRHFNEFIITKRNIQRNLYLQLFLFIKVLLRQPPDIFMFALIKTQRPALPILWYNMPKKRIR